MYADLEASPEDLTPEVAAKTALEGADPRDRAAAESILAERSEAAATHVHVSPVEDLRNEREEEQERHGERGAHGDLRPLDPPRGLDVGHAVTSNILAPLVQSTPP